MLFAVVGLSTLVRESVKNLVVGERHSENKLDFYENLFKAKISRIEMIVSRAPLARQAIPNFHGESHATCAHFEWLPLL